MDPPKDGPVASALLDRFTRVDELLEDTNDSLDDVLDAVETLEDITATTDDLAQAISQLSETIGSDGELDIRREFPFPLSAEVPEETGANDEFFTSFDAPYDARVTQVVVEANQATQQGVGVRVGTAGGDVWIPRGGETYTVETDEYEEPYFLAAPTQPVVFRPNVRVDEGSPVRCQYGNNDTENPHFATVVPILREV